MPTPRNEEILPLILVILGTGLVVVGALLYFRDGREHPALPVVVSLLGVGLVPVARRSLLRRSAAARRSADADR